MKKYICLLLTMLLLLTSCAPGGKQPDAASAKTAVQAYLTEHIGSEAALDSIAITQSSSAEDILTVTCEAAFLRGSNRENGTFILTYVLQNGAWTLTSCRQQLTTQDFTEPAPSTEVRDTSTLLIPGDAFRFDGHSYFVYDDSTIRTWEDAQLFCESLGGYLAVIASEEENTALYKYVKSQGYTQVFFGLSDAGHEGMWRWVDQEESHYWNWHVGQPNGGEKDNYVQFVDNYVDGSNSHSGEWSDSVYGSSQIYVFLCEWPGE